ncbi:hypothetical protein [Actinoplanes teichomyceticus]|uniref:Subtilisin inhibitor-like n=1 Tax=Actinoplanes teichomyceticus TaxID=1867 RepID=A0A561WJW6_ACTTI|nr:hypothetical protein [Actinoplanes teichomyceticus]TWG24164.1 hypothetical protein FHX34_102717 [Actinoplanes teichomyceticus]GIF12992.1 hypothetical protein Ate01nite_30240 [Actinoplanes teichomyceticus]
MRIMLLAGILPAVLAPAAAQAAPCPTTAMLGTYDFGRAGVIGAAGQAAGVWSAATVRSGFAGDDLIVTYTPRHTPSATERMVYTALFNEVDDPRAECHQVGADGVARHVWVSYRCRTGIAPNYTLLVR